jgi:hypothetical protein
MGYHLNAAHVSRGKGQSVIAKAAYNAREKILEERTGETKDYSRHKDQPLASFIFAPKDAPEWAHDRARLWNEVDRYDDHKNAQLGYNFIAALPHELTDQQREYIVKDFAREQFMRKGLVADVQIHAPEAHGDERNHHVHMLVTMREVTPQGFGERVSGWQDWGQNLATWREKWAERGAKELEKAGFEVEAGRWREGHRTQEQQCEAALERGDLEWAEKKSQEATKHRGPTVDAMERKGPETDRGKEARELSDWDKLLAELKAVQAQRDRVKEMGEQVADRMAHLEANSPERLQAAAAWQKFADDLDAEEAERDRVKEMAEQAVNPHAIGRDLESFEHQTANNLEASAELAIDIIGSVADKVAEGISSLVDSFTGTHSLPTREQIIQWGEDKDERARQHWVRYTVDKNYREDYDRQERERRHKEATEYYSKKEKERERGHERERER